MTLYFEVFGKVKAKIEAIQQKRIAARKAMIAFAKKHGTDSIGVYENIGVSFVLDFKKGADEKLWKKVKGNSTFYSPRLSSKEGKSLEKEMTDICRASPSLSDVGNAIGLSAFSGFSWRTPGLNVVGKRIFVTTCDDYKIPKKLAADIKRISDLEFERLTKE